MATYMLAKGAHPTRCERLSPIAFSAVFVFTPEPVEPLPRFKILRFFDVPVSLSLPLPLRKSSASTCWQFG